MRQVWRKISILSFVLAFACLPARQGFFNFDEVWAADINQQILDLRKQIEELEKQSQKYKGTIASKQKEALSLKREIDILNNQIYKLETEIKITKNQISSTGLVIGDLETKIYDRQEDISRKRQAVGTILNLIHKNDQENFLNIVLKNKNLSDFIGQAQQADNLNRSLLAAITVIKNEKESLEVNKGDLEVQKQELEKLNSSQKNKQYALGSTKTSKDTLLDKTKGQEATYQKLLADVEKREMEFFAELKKLESQALSSGAFIVHVTASGLPPRGTKLFKYPEEDYRLTQGYGYTTYARRGAYGGAPHNGIDMASGYGTAIRPVAEGKILASGFNSGFGNWVAVRHVYDLVSVYAHMNAPSGLTNGTSVSVGDIIGYEGSTGNSTGSHLHFSVYRDFFTYINEKNNQLYFNYYEGSLNPLDYL
ncbi:MAG: peptidoglycan DD-metalloendopeptidase family protein [bacterium]|nr:peptidoglycan DD-metalloendopeptidase family protein [bacterium]